MPQIANGDSGAATRALINFVLPRTVAFATTPPLDGNAVMAARTVAGALAFTVPASPVLGAQCQLRLTADGANAPSFAGFVEHGSSAGYLNTAGIVNLVRFWHDGVTSWFAVSQAFNVVPFVMQSAAIANATPTQIQITFDRALNASIVPAASAFAITNSGGADTISALSIAGAVVTLTKSRTTLATDTVSVAYTAPGTNPLTDTNGNLAGGGTIAVTNGVSGAAGGSGYLRYDHRPSNVAETPDGGGYDYTPGGTFSYSDNIVIYSSARLPAGADGFASHTIAKAQGGGPVLALHTDAAPADTNTAPFALMDNTAYSANWIVIANGGVVSGIATVAVADGDMPRLRRAGSTMIAEVSKNGGTSWVTVYTWTGVTMAALTPMVKFGADGGNTSGITQPKCSTNVA